MDTVFINGLVVEAIIGCYEQEKHKPQSIRFDIEMAWDIRKAGESDLLEDTLDYHAVTKKVSEFSRSNRFKLVETLAERVAHLIMKDFEVPGVRMRLSKLEALDNTIDVGVRISRGIEF